MDLRATLIKTFEDSYTVSQYKQYERWVMTHIDRICDGYNDKTWNWVKIGCKVYFNQGGFITEAKIEGFIINVGFNHSYVGFKTSQGNIWYFEGFKRKKEAKKFVQVD
jgi:hypothetical protein